MIAKLGRRQAPEQRRAAEQLRALAKPYRFRVRADAEGFPIIPGRYGQIEWFDGQDLAVYTNRPRLFARLWAIPGREATPNGRYRDACCVPTRGAGAGSYGNSGP